METQSAVVETSREGILELDHGVDKDGSDTVDTNEGNSHDHTTAEMHPSINVPPLPEGWVEVVHSSGGTVYFNTANRVCTWSRPYQVSLNRKIKQHGPPLASIPCLQQFVLKENGKVDNGVGALVEKWVSDVRGNKTKLARIDPARLREYLGLQWTHTEQSNVLSTTAQSSAILNESGVGEGEAVSEEITESTVSSSEKKEKAKDSQIKETNGFILPKHLKKCILRQTGRKAPEVLSVKGDNSALSLLYHLMQAHLRAKVDLETTESDNDDWPYSAFIYINGMYHGSGHGGTKRQAKHNAASFVMDLLLEKKYSDRNEGEQTSLPAYVDSLRGVGIASEKVLSKLSEARLPTPWTVLKQCVLKSESFLQEKLSFTTEDGRGGDTEYVLSVGEGHCVEGKCQKVKDGRNVASQTMLQKLYPYLCDWSAVMCVYDDIVRGKKRSSKSTKDCDGPPSKKTKHSFSNPNTALLDRLKAEMSSLAKDMKVPFGDHQWKERLLSFKQ
jgi:hypothetical protein